MTVISSQRYLNDEIVSEKVEELRGDVKVVLPVYDSELADDDGNTLFVLADGHHRLEAAKELGIPVEYEVIRHQDDLVGEQLLDNNWIDSDWYYIESGKTVW